MSAHMRQSRRSFASANVDLATGSRRSPLPYSFDGCAPRHASRIIAQALAIRHLANVMMRNCSLPETADAISPHSARTIRSKLVPARKSIIWPKTASGQRSRQRSPIRKNRENYRKITKAEFKSTPNERQALTYCSPRIIQATRFAYRTVVILPQQISRGPNSQRRATGRVDHLIGMTFAAALNPLSRLAKLLHFATALRGRR